MCLPDNCMKNIVLRWLRWKIILFIVIGMQILEHVIFPLFRIQLQTLLNSNFYFDLIPIVAFGLIPLHYFCFNKEYRNFMKLPSWNLKIMILSRWFAFVFEAVSIIIFFLVLVPIAYDLETAQLHAAMNEGVVYALLLVEPYDFFLFLIIDNKLRDVNNTMKLGSAKFLILGFILLGAGSLTLSLPFYHDEGIQPTQPINIAYSNGVDINNLQFNFVTGDKDEHIIIDYSLYRNSSIPTFFAIVLPYNGKILPPTEWNQKNFTDLKSNIIYKKFAGSGKREVGMISDTNHTEIDYKIDGKFESFRFPSNYIQIPFSRNPFNNDKIGVFLDSLRSKGNNTLAYDWAIIRSQPLLKVTIDKKFDEWNTQPIAGIGYSSISQTGYHDIVLTWNITNDYPLYVLNYSEPLFRFLVSFLQTLGGTLIGVGFSIIILRKEIVSGEESQKSLAQFITKSRHIQDAEHFYSIGKHKDAVRSNKKLLELFPEDISTMINIGASLDYLNEHEQALFYYDKVLKKEPSNIGALNNKAHSLSKLGRYEEAVTEYEKILRICSQDDYALFNIGILYLENLNDYDKAIKCFGKILAINPKDVDALANIAIAIFYQNKYNLTIKCCDKTLKIQSNNLQALTARGNALLKLGQLREAKACYEIALKIDPLASTTLLNMGNVLIGLNELDNGLSYLHEYLVTNPTDVSALKLIRDVYHRLNDQNNENYWNAKYNKALRKQ